MTELGTLLWLAAISRAQGMGGFHWSMTLLRRNFDVAHGLGNQAEEPEHEEIEAGP